MKRRSRKALEYHTLDHAGRTLYSVISVAIVGSVDRLIAEGRRNVAAVLCRFKTVSQMRNSSTPMRVLQSHLVVLFVAPMNLHCNSKQRHK